MSYTYALGKARTSSAASPTTTSYTVAPGDTLLVLMIKTTGATVRAGGAPSLGGVTFVQANATQKAATTPEASAELWYLLNPTPGTSTLTVPNTGAATLKYTVGVGRATPGGRSTFLGANGGNGTSTNPTPGAIPVGDPSSIAFAINANGATTWAPSAQAGTVIANTDDGADGGGEQYRINAPTGALTLNWTFATSDDWGAVAALFGEVAPHRFQNYLATDAGTGISVTEKIR
jgi:hypothetical protein